MWLDGGRRILFFIIILFVVDVGYLLLRNEIEILN